jgi:hypothetical protein
MTSQGDMGGHTDASEALEARLRDHLQRIAKATFAARAELWAAKPQLRDGMFGSLLMRLATSGIAVKHAGNMVGTMYAFVRTWEDGDIKIPRFFVPWFPGDKLLIARNVLRGRRSTARLKALGAAGEQIVAAEDAFAACSSCFVALTAARIHPIDAALWLAAVVSSRGAGDFAADPMAKIEIKRLQQELDRLLAPPPVQQDLALDAPGKVAGIPAISVASRARGRIRSR